MMDATTARESQVLQLRQEGRSFAAIATQLGYERARDVWLAFNRALRRHAPEEQATLRRAEMARLEARTDAIRVKADITPEEQARRLDLIERMRVRLLAV